MRRAFALVMCIVLIWPAAVFAGDISVPQVMSFQSALFDDGGNPVADGDVGATFRITDSAGAILYEEHQTMRAAGGFVGALVGNGIAASGAPAGPIPTAIFDVDGPLYLEVQADGESPMPAMEIASVPFAMRSEVALRVAEGAVESGSIADGGISFEDLSSQAVEEIAKAITGGRDTGGIVFREDMETMYRTPTSAALVGVRPEFIYSGSNNLQDVLADFDRSIKARDERVTSETEARVAADNAEISARQAAITAEATARRSADESEASTRESADTAEATTRWNADFALSGRIDSEATARAEADTSLSSRIETEITDRTNADTNLDNRITNEITTTNTNISVSISETENSMRTHVTETINSHSRQFASAWGSVGRNWDADGAYVLNAGFNVNDNLELVEDNLDQNRDGVVHVNTMHITFISPMPSNNYVVLATINFREIPTADWQADRDFGAGIVPVYEKGVDGFSVKYGGPTFDFIVFGP